MSIDDAIAHHCQALTDEDPDWLAEYGDFSPTLSTRFPDVENAGCVCGRDEMPALPDQPTGQFAGATPVSSTPSGVSRSSNVPVFDACGGKRADRRKPPATDRSSAAARANRCRPGCRAVAVCVAEPMATRLQRAMAARVVDEDVGIGSRSAPLPFVSRWLGDVRCGAVRPCQGRLGVAAARLKVRIERALHDVSRRDALGIG